MDIDTQAALDAVLTRFAQAEAIRMSIEGLYAPAICNWPERARSGAVQRPTARATVLSNRFCGDEVRLEVRVEEG